MPYKTTRTLSHFLVAITITFVVILIEPHIYAGERIRALGKDTLGESVKEFRARHAKAKCGKITSIDINAQSLVDTGNSDDIHCCLNDKNSLSEVSRFPILNLDGCAVHAIFRKNRLCNLSYMLDVRSVQIVLDEFEKLYGPPARKQKDPEDTSTLIFVDWMEGMTSLELRLSRLAGGGLSKDSPQPKGESWLQTVSISLWDDDLAHA